MATKKPISTISFNTSCFLDSALKSLVSSGQIMTYIYIRHLAESDTKKEHFHVYLQPSRPVDPQKIRTSFIEPSFDGKGDLGCLPFVPSKLHDWACNG